MDRLSDLGDIAGRNEPQTCRADTAAPALRPGDRPAHLRPAWSRAVASARCAAAAVLVFAFGAALLGAPAGAQAGVLVSNFGRDTTTPVALNPNEMAQGFRTGTNAGGYALESIEIDFSLVPSSSDASSLTATLWSSTINDRPDSFLATLTNPSGLSDSNSTNVKAFSAPAGTGRLKVRTFYFVHLSYTGDTDVSLDRTSSVYEDHASRAAGWTINNIRLYRPVGTTVGWTPSSLGLSPGQLRIRINGRNNAAPMAADSMVTTNEDTPHVFTAADFNFADADARDSLAGVKIVTLPAEGTLALDSTPVTTDQVIPRADIDGGRLRFTPAANAYGDAHASFTFKVNDGTVNGAAAYTMTVNVTPMNDPATGSPAITVPGGGPPTVGATLAATSTINDADGVGDFSYQWIRVDGATENNISEATSASYQVTAADVGKKLKVRVRFTDGAGNPESRTSGPTAVVAAPTTPTVTLALTPASIPENGGTSTVTATLDRPSSETTTIEISAAPVTPAAAADFSLTSNRRLTFAAGATMSTGTVRITARNNGIYTPNKAVTVSGTATNGMGIDQPQPLTLTIVEDDTESTAVTLSVAPNTVSEGATGNAQRVTVTATLDEAARPEATAVRVTVAGDTATAGVDFTAVQDFTMTIPADATSAMETFTLAPLNDNADEPDETVRISGTTTAGLSVLPAAGVSVAISDNDPVPQVSLVLTPASISEDGGTSTVTATLDRPSSADTTITVSAAAGTNADTDDFSLTGTTLTIAAGTTESTGTVTVTAIDNAIDHPDREVEVSGLATNTQGIAQPSEQTLNIADDEDTSATPSTGITMTVSPDRVAEDATGSARNVTVAATLNGDARDADTEVIVSVENGTAFAGTDFAEVADFTITIAAEAVSGTHTFTLAPVDDEKDAPDRTILLRGKTTAAGLSVEPLVGLSVTIEDDDPEPVVTLALTPAEIREDDGESTVTATLDRPSSAAIRVNVTAAPVTPAVAGDFRLSGNRRLTIAAGQTTSTGTVTLAAVDNDIAADDRMVEVSGTATTNDTRVGVVQPEALRLTITADDQPSTMVTLTVSPDRVAENGGARRLTVTGMLDGAPESADTVVTLTVTEGAAEAVEATLTIPTGQRSATAALTLTPVDNAIDADATVRVNASTTSSLTLNPSSLEVTVTDDDERGVRVTPVALTVIEGPEGGASYTVVLGSQPTSTVTVTPSVSSEPPGANLSVSPSNLSFTTSNWNEPQTVSVTAQDDQDVEEDAAVEVMHTVSGGDYVSVTAASVTVTVPGFEIMADGSVYLRVPISGEPVVTVPEGTSIPAGTRVTVPSSLAGGTVRFAMVADDHEALTDPPRGFRTGDAVLDIEPNPPLPAGQTATVCLPASSGSQRVHRYDEDETPPEWVALDPPPSGSPRGLACGVTDRFMLFALGSAPNETVAQAWLARFGRTAAQHVLDGIRERLSAAREAGFRGKLGGHEIGTYRAGIQGDRTEDGSGWNGPGQNGLWQNGLGRNDDGLSPWRIGTRDRGDTAADPFHDGGPGLRGWWRPVAERELITGTAFTATGGAEGDSYTVWGRGAHTRFDGRDGNGALDGAVTTATFGGDWSFDRWIAGLSMSHSRGSGGYRPDDREDRLEASVTGLYPYVGYKLTDRVSVWGATGYGKGELSLTPDGGEAIDTDLSLWMAAAGARSELLKRTGPDGPALALDADGLLVRTSTPAMSRAAGDLAAVAADTSRLRLKLAGSWATTLEDQARLTPSLEIGFRHDGGEAEDGFGLDLGGGLAYAVPAHGFTVEINGRWLLAHRDSAFRDWGVSGSLRYDPRPSSERGLNLSVTSSVGGSAKGGANALFGQGLPAGPAANDNSVPGLGLTTELSYGFSALGGTAVQIPWAAWSLTESDGQTVRLGWRLRLGPGGSSADFGIEAGRSERQRAVPDYRIGIALRLPLGGGPAFLGGSGEALPD